jgi:hypothetical protein
VYDILFTKRLKRQHEANTFIRTTVARMTSTSSLNGSSNTMRRTPPSASQSRARHQLAERLEQHHEANASVRTRDVRDISSPA